MKNFIYFSRLIHEFLESDEVENDEQGGKKRI